MLIASILNFLTPASAAAGQERCGNQSTLATQHLECKVTTEDVRTQYHSAPPTVKHRLVPLCVWGVTELCNIPMGCHLEEKSTYAFERAPVATEDWELVTYICLGDETEITETITETEVREAFKTLTWPSADLIIDPDTRTLVNADTVFHTTRTDPVTQTITLLGVHITLEATPTSWTWHWAQPGDTATAADLTPTTTNTPGTPRPHPTVTHTYTLKGEANPSVDVTYTGRYRINDRPWQDIADTHTVPGTPVTLTIHEARPRLIR